MSLCSQPRRPCSIGQTTAVWGWRPIVTYVASCCIRLTKADVSDPCAGQRRYQGNRAGDGRPRRQYGQQAGLACWRGPQDEISKTQKRRWFGAMFLFPDMTKL